MNAPVAAPSRTERTEAYRNASWPERVAIHDAVAAAKADAIAQRRELGRRYLDAHPVGCTVPFDRAVLFQPMVEQAQAARAEATALADGRAFQHNSDSLGYTVLGKDFAADSHAIRLMTSPEILAPIVRYCGMLPVFFNMFVTRAYQNELLANSAHHFHLDPEDTISFKTFVHLTDVDEDCGPFHALPSAITQTVLDAIGYRGTSKVTDEQVKDLVGWDKVVKVVGPPGTVAFVDTTRCLHFGGRPRKAGKPIRDMLVAQYLLPTSGLFPIAGDTKHPNFLPTLTPTGDVHWDALIGATLT